MSLWWQNRAGPTLLEKIRGSESSSSVGLMTGRYSIDTKVTCGYKGCKRFWKYYFSAYWGEESLKEEQLWRLGLVASPHQCVHTSRKPGNLGFGIHTLDQVFYIITCMYNNRTHSLPWKEKLPPQRHRLNTVSSCKCPRSKLKKRHLSKRTWNIQSMIKGEIRVGYVLPQYCPN